MQADEILEHLDECQNALPFLANDGRMHLADARLTVFRSPEKWAAVFEMPYFSDGEGGFYNWDGAAGNCLRAGDCAGVTTLSHEPLFQLLELEASEDGIDDPYRAFWLADRAQFSIVLDGKRLDFAPTAENYETAEIVFEDEATGAGSLEPGLLLRYLCHHLAHPFFSDEAQLRGLLTDDAAQLPMFLQTRHWHHPVYLVDSWMEDEVFDDDHIRNIEGFAILARAIASGDLSEWHAQDPTTFNTDWPSLEAIRRENS